MPSPIKERDAAVRMDWATLMVAITIRGEMALGNTCLKMILAFEQLMEVAASRYSILRMFRMDARIIRA